MTEVDKNCSYYKDIVKEESLADYITRLKQENEKLKENLDDLTKDLKVQNEIIGKFEQALEEIREILNKNCGIVSNAEAVGIINEVLNN